MSRRLPSHFALPFRIIKVNVMGASGEHSISQDNMEHFTGPRPVLILPALLSGCLFIGCAAAGNFSLIKYNPEEFSRDSLQYTKEGVSTHLSLHRTVRTTTRQFVL